MVSPTKLLPVFGLIRGRGTFVNCATRLNEPSSWRDTTSSFPKISPLKCAGRKMRSPQMQGDETPAGSSVFHNTFEVGPK